MVVHGSDNMRCCCFGLDCEQMCTYVNDWALSFAIVLARERTFMHRNVKAFRVRFFQNILLGVSST